MGPPSATARPAARDPADIFISRPSAGLASARPRQGPGLGPPLHGPRKTATLDIATVAALNQQAAAERERRARVRESGAGGPGRRLWLPERAPARCRSWSWLPPASQEEREAREAVARQRELEREAAKQKREADKAALRAARDAARAASRAASDPGAAKRVEVLAGLRGERARAWRR